jgi:hypothetical protein
MFMRLRLKTKHRIATLLLVLASIVAALIPFTSAFAATSADVTVTATPTYIAVTNGVSGFAVSLVAESNADSYWWKSDGTVQSKPAEPFVDGGMASTITNTGSVNEDIKVKVTSTTWTGGVGWTVAGTVGVDTIVVKAGITGMANEAAMVTLTGSDQTLKSALAAAGTVKWTLHVETGTFTDGAAKSGMVRITAAAS